MRKLILGLVLSSFFAVGFAQKKPLDHSVYDSWQSIGSSEISGDGQYVSFTITPQEGDSKLRLVDRNANNITTIDRGTQAGFTSDSKFLIALIKPFYQDVRQAKIDKKKSDEMPKDSLALFSIAGNELEKIANVKSFKLPEEGFASIVSFLIEDTVKAEIDSVGKDSTLTKDIKKNKADKQSKLVLRNLDKGVERSFDYVESYELNKDGSLLVFHKKLPKKDSLKNEDGLYLYHVKTDDLKGIKKGKGDYKHIVFDEASQQIAFTYQPDVKNSINELHDLYYFNLNTDSALLIAKDGSEGIPENWSVNGSQELTFSKDGKKLFFGLAPIARLVDTTIVDFEVAKVDIWHWKDDYLQPRQLLNRKRDSSRAYLSVIYPETRKIVPLGDEGIPSISITSEGNNEFALGTSDVGRRVASQWLGASYDDVYLISTLTGERFKIADSIRANVDLSPKGDYVLWFDRDKGHWYSYSVDDKQLRTLTEGLGVQFFDEENDMPDQPRSYGFAGWNQAGDVVYLYDRYDIWAVPLQGKKPKMVTNGFGRKHKISFRYDDPTRDRFQRARREPVIIDWGKFNYISAFDHNTKESGWFTASAKGRDPELVTMEPFRYNGETADKNFTLFAYTKENYTESPNLYLSADFKSETVVSDINQQQSSYNWGTAELFEWTASNGKEAEGILYKPEDFDENKQYPMIVYFYEKLSDGLYSYIPPTPTPSRLNISFFVSNGYLVFAPDIAYDEGYPGKSAEIYINSGVEALKQLPFIDGDHIGIQGQSWGGYQVAHLITRTDMYAAAWSGAPVVNMTSAYGGIRWASGLNRQFQYEHTQSRIGATLWEDLDLYIENSPLFHLDKVNTPVVIMHNDRDGAVPWYQGIEMFTALRRLGKPVWMLNYNDDEHNLMKRQNRKDIQIREQQFFDHYLKGKPAPVWLERGVPAVLKGIDWGFDLVE